MIKDTDKILSLLQELCKLLEMTTGCKSAVIMIGEKEFPCPDPGCLERHKVNCMAVGFKNAKDLKTFVDQSLSTIPDSQPKKEDGIISPFYLQDNPPTE